MHFDPLDLELEFYRFASGDF